MSSETNKPQEYPASEQSIKMIVNRTRLIAEKGGMRKATYSRGFLYDSICTLKDGRKMKTRFREGENSFRCNLAIRNVKKAGDYIFYIWEIYTTPESFEGNYPDHLEYMYELGGYIHITQNKIQKPSPVRIDQFSQILHDFPYPIREAVREELQVRKKAHGTLEERQALILKSFLYSVDLNKVT